MKPIDLNIDCLENILDHLELSDQMEQIHENGYTKLRVSLLAEISTQNGTIRIDSNFSNFEDFILWNIKYDG